jgi:hypothetical protein
MTDAELDTAVAVEVMGWKRYSNGYGTGVDKSNFINDARWRPSTNIANAWQVVERMNTLGHLVIFYSGFVENGKYIVSVYPPKLTHLDPLCKVEASAAPRAICEASLEAVRRGK